jgi:hypothetical protein
VLKTVYVCGQTATLYFIGTVVYNLNQDFS